MQMEKNNLIFSLAFMATMLAPLASHADVRGFFISDFLMVLALPIGLKLKLQINF